MNIAFNDGRRHWMIITCEEWYYCRWKKSQAEVIVVITTKYQFKYEIGLGKKSLCFVDAIYCCQHVEHVQKSIIMLRVEHETFVTSWNLTNKCVPVPCGPVHTHSLRYKCQMKRVIVLARGALKLVECYPMCSEL